MINLDELKTKLMATPQDHKHPDWVEGRLIGIEEAFEAIRIDKLNKSIDLTTRNNNPLTIKEI